MLAILVLVFICVGPLLLLLASGYSFKDVVSLTKISILRTGGIYVASVGSNASVYIDNKLAGTSSFLDRSVLVQGLTTKQHTVRVERPEYRTWEKKVGISPNKVTQIYPVLISKQVSFVSVKSSADISSLNKAYAKKVDLIISTTTGDIIFDDSKISLTILKDNINIIWKDTEDSPQYMCTLNNCESELNITASEQVLDAELYKGSQSGLIVLGKDHIFITELDSRGGRISIPVFSASDFKISNFNKSALVSFKGSTYLKNSGNYYKLNLEPTPISS